MARAARELESFVRDAWQRGISPQAIEQALTRAGWPIEQVRAALAAHANADFPLPVPQPHTSLPAREAFLYLVLFTTLYLSAYQLGALLFELISRGFPDGSMPFDNGHPQSIRGSIATILIAFPLLLLLSAKIGRDLRRQQISRESTVRRWLTYITLFVAAVVLIGDLITLVNNVLGGELTLRFVLKVVVAGTIAGVIFSYYLWDLRAERQPSGAINIARLLALAASAAMLAAVAGGLRVVGSPAHQRALQQDAHRLQDLNMAAASIHRYWARKHSLPSDLAAPDLRGSRPDDPVSGKPYGYKPLTGDEYNLCADFSAAFDVSENTLVQDVYLPHAQSWKHPAGAYCFTFHADSNDYQPDSAEVPIP